MYSTKTKNGRAVRKAPKQPAPSRTAQGPGKRRLDRRLRRRTTSLDMRMVLDGMMQPGTATKRAQKATRRAIRLRRAARYLTGLLIRATGTAAPALVLSVKVQDRYHEGLAAAGARAIYFPNKPKEAV